jgi:hypothetical protein
MGKQGGKKSACLPLADVGSLDGIFFRTGASGSYHLFLGSEKFRQLPCEHGNANVPGPGDLFLIDVDGNGKINITDPIYLLNFLFNGGPKPVLGGLEDPCVSLGGCPDACS